MKQKPLYVQLLNCWVILAMLCGCLSQSRLPITEEAAVAPSSPSDPTRASLTPTATSTTRPTVTPTPELSATQTPTVTRTPAPSWTPLPTLSPGEAEKQIRELMHTNGSCALPCWWGIIPGDTRWKEAEHFLRPFTTITPTSSGRIEINRESKRYSSYEIQSNFLKDRTVRLFGISVIEGVVTFIVIYPQVTSTSFNLHQLLSDYGLPEQVFIRTFSNLPEQYLPFYLVLYYPRQRILAYYLYESQLVAETLRACPMPHRPEKLWVWSREEDFVDRRGIEELVFGEFSIKSKSLEEATDLDIQQFYEIYRDPATWECFETPAMLW